MDDDVKGIVIMILTGTLSAVIIGSSIFLMGYFSVQQRHAFIVKCMADLGDNNIELCSSIAK